MDKLSNILSNREIYIKVMTSLLPDKSHFTEHPITFLSVFPRDTPAFSSPQTQAHAVDAAWESMAIASDPLIPKKEQLNFSRSMSMNMLPSSRIIPSCKEV